MIKITQHNDRWRVSIKEVLEFRDYEKMKETSDELIQLKKNHGQLGN